MYPNPGAFRSQPKSEITVIDTATQTVVERKPLHNVAGAFHLATSADGKPGRSGSAQAEESDSSRARGARLGLWRFAHFIWRTSAERSRFPLDELDRYYALPWGVAIAPDKSKMFLTTAGSQSVTVIDVPRLLKTVRTRRQPFVNDLSASAEYVSSRIPVGHNPRGVALSPDGKRLYVANRLDDTSR